MDELISRDLAIKALGDAHFKYYGNAILVIKELPAVHVESKKGQWIHHTGGFADHYECTACGNPIILTEMWDFCPNCGADMRRSND